MVSYWVCKIVSSLRIDHSTSRHLIICLFAHLLTSDQAILHENGYAEIVGRIKDMVIRGGENIYPREIEESLHKHSKIIEAQVVGVPDHRMGEELCAWIRIQDGETLDEEEVKSFCKGEVRKCN